MRIEIRRAHWAQDAAALSHIRRTVFIVEQGVAKDLEWDGEDEHAIHLLALTDARPCGTARILPTGQIGRMAVLPRYRRRGIARALLHEAISANAQAAWPTPFVHAQTAVAELYRQAGFQAEGPVFIEADIPHQLMRLRDAA